MYVLYVCNTVASIWPHFSAPAGLKANSRLCESLDIYQQTEDDNKTEVITTASKTKLKCVPSSTTFAFSEVKIAFFQNIMALLSLTSLSQESHISTVHLPFCHLCHPSYITMAFYSAISLTYWTRFRGLNTTAHVVCCRQKAHHAAPFICKLC